MTMPRFLFALGYTVYILSTVRRLEEPDLATELGEVYVKYIGSVPRFVPFLT